MFEDGAQKQHHKLEPNGMLVEDLNLDWQFPKFIDGIFINKCLIYQKIHA